MAAGGLYLLLTSPWAADRVKEKMVEFLAERFDADVRIDTVAISLVPKLAIDGRGLNLTRRGEDPSTPFMRLAQFHVSGTPLQLLRRRVTLVTVDGFEVRIQRGRQDSPDAKAKRSFPTHDVAVERIAVRNGVLLILPRDARKLPLQFDLQEIAMDDFSFNRSAGYRARLINPRPRGAIDSTGEIGPWNTYDLGSTPLSGGYTFAQADLSTIKGISGTLTSTGTFDGVLERISARGVTSTPDFALNLAGQPVKLDTRYRAVIDGTSGDTYLEEVDAMLGSSHILAKGSVAGAPGAKGRTIALQVQIENGRFEDFLRLTVKGAQPPMRGALSVRSAFELPPGEADVPARLRLTGTFGIRGGRFTSDTVQNKIDGLSRRGRGEPTNQDVRDVTSTFGGSLALRDGVLRLPRFEFRVRGAVVDLGGSYQLRGETLDFAGTLNLDAPLSKTTTGFKSLLLKAVDPLFRRRGAGASLPIKISGTVDKPNFGLDVGRVFKR